MKNLFSNWLKHPTYFMFWFFLGLFAWSFSFQNKSESIAKNELSPSRQVSSFNESYDNSSDLPNKNMSDEEFYNLEMAELQNSNQTHEFDFEQPFVMTEDQIAEYENVSEGLVNLDEAESEKHLQNKKFHFESVSADDLNYLITPEQSAKDPKDPKNLNFCSDSRNYIEKIINGNPKIKEWTEERKEESSLLPRKCIAFVMNSFPEVTTKQAAVRFKESKSPMFAKCPKGSFGGPLLTGSGRPSNPVPCVSKNLVNLTYNAYVDVMSCLNIDPRDLLPKIYNESGFYINALGGGMDGGIGQLTQPAIEQVNSIYPKFIEEINKAALAKPNGACARIIKNKAFLAPVKPDVSYRCGLLYPTENPVRNLLYAAILTRYNMKYVSGISYEAGEDVIVDGNTKTPVTGTAKDELAGKFKDLNIRKKLEFLGMTSVNLHSFKKMITLAGYNSGVGSAMNVFNNYLDMRIAAKQKSKSNKYDLKPSDFDFVATKDLAREARSYIMSSFIRPKDSAKVKEDKIKKRKQLPVLWANAYTKTFPEFIVYRLNAYKGDKSGNFAIYGFPGYLTALAEKNKMIRDTFSSNGVNPDSCSTEAFLNFQEPVVKKK